jgi:hypothetical protein
MFGTPGKTPAKLYKTAQRAKLYKKRQRDFPKVPTMWCCTLSTIDSCSKK